LSADNARARDLCVDDLQVTATGNVDRSVFLLHAIHVPVRFCFSHFKHAGNHPVCHLPYSSQVLSGNCPGGFSERDWDSGIMASSRRPFCRWSRYPDVEYSAIQEKANVGQGSDSIWVLFVHLWNSPLYEVVDPAIEIQVPPYGVVDPPFEREGNGPASGRDLVSRRVRSRIRG